MHRIRVGFLLVVLIIAGWSPPLLAKETPELSRGALLAMSCFACHRQAGQTPGQIPHIHGLPADLLVLQMQSFRQGRPATVMDRHAKGYTDEELRLMADYIATLSPTPK